MLGPTLTRMEHVGFSMMAIPEPTETTLHGHAVIGLYFGADWCQPCLVFTPVLERLYLARRARGADQFEVVLVSRCQEAKAMKYYHEDMPWLSMWHEVDDEAGMKAHTASLMAKFGITSIPALVLLEKRGGLICADA
jgi:nucleoredoxin